MLKMHCTMFRTFPGLVRPLPQLSRSPLVQILHDESRRRPSVHSCSSSRNNESFVNSKPAITTLSSQADYNPIIFRESPSASSSTIKMGVVPEKKPVELNAESSKGKDGGTPGSSAQGGADEKPNFDVLQQVNDSLIQGLSNLFVKPMNYKIYREDILFIDNIRGKRTQGLGFYIQQVAFLRAIGHVKFAFVKFVILNTDVSKEEGRITVRWRIVGISALKVMLQFWRYKLWDWKGIMEKQGTWYDGVSYYDVDGNGKIYRHVADKMMVDKDKDEIGKPIKPILASALLAVLIPGSSLNCKLEQDFSKKSSSQVIDNSSS